jgi:hypothetical protein
VVLADLREASARAAAGKLVGAGQQAVAIGCDIAVDAQVAAMVVGSSSRSGVWTRRSTLPA